MRNKQLDSSACLKSDPHLCFQRSTRHLSPWCEGDPGPKDVTKEFTKDVTKEFTKDVTKEVTKEFT